MSDSANDATPNASGSIVPYETRVPQTFEEVKSMGTVFYEAGVFSDLRSAAQAILKIQAGKELGIGAIYSLSRLYIVEGKLGMAAETMGALIKRSGKYNYRVIEHTDQKCSIEFLENGKSVYISTFTMEDARRANLVKPGGGWAKYPRALLFSRALSQGARIVAPDAIGGAYTEEELRSIEPEEGKFTPVEGTNEGAVESSVSASVETPEIDENNPYASFLEACPEHGDRWFVNKYGKRCHRMPDGSWCNFSNQIKQPFADEANEAGFADKEALREWLSNTYGGKTPSKLTEEEQIDALGKLVAMKENSLVQEAVKEGAEVVSSEES